MTDPITPDEFRKNWCDQNIEALCVFSAESVADVQIPKSQIEFLMLAGLPRSAAPFLDFNSPKQGALHTAESLWRLSNDFKRYRAIGSSGNGDSICLDEECAGQVVLLNHDNKFQRVLINSSVHQLAALLLAYRKLVRQAQQQNGQDALLDGRIPQELKDRFETDLLNIDFAASGDDCFWFEELHNLNALPLEE